MRSIVNEVDKVRRISELELEMRRLDENVFLAENSLWVAILDDVRG